MAPALGMPPVVLAMVTVAFVMAMAIAVALTVVLAFPMVLAVALPGCVLHLGAVGPLSVVSGRMRGQGENRSTEQGGNHQRHGGTDECP